MSEKLKNFDARSLSTFLFNGDMDSAFEAATWAHDRGFRVLIKISRKGKVKLRVGETLVDTGEVLVDLMNSLMVLTAEEAEAYLED